MLKLDVVTAEGETFSGVCDFVTAPGILGEMTILPSHAPLITSLAAGELRFRQGGETHSLVVTGGFLEVLNNEVIVLANAAEDEGEIDLDRATAAMERARERVASSGDDADLEGALASLSRAQVRVRLARRWRERGGTRPGRVEQPRL
jgi:F-type H+-transporting ATPase subunit epsilon